MHIRDMHCISRCRWCTRCCSFAGGGHVASKSCMMEAHCSLMLQVSCTFQAEAVGITHQEDIVCRCQEVASNCYGRCTHCSTMLCVVCALQAWASDVIHVTGEGCGYHIYGIHSLCSEQLLWVLHTLQANAMGGTCVASHSQTTQSAPSHPLRHPRTGVSPTHLCLLAD